MTSLWGHGLKFKGLETEDLGLGVSDWVLEFTGRGRGRQREGGRGGRERREGSADKHWQQLTKRYTLHPKP